MVDVELWASLILTIVIGKSKLRRQGQKMSIGIFVFIMFFVLLVVGRDELGWRGIIISIALWAAINALFVIFSLSPFVYWV